MRPTDRRGSVLLHVLVTSSVVGLIAASLLRLSMLRHKMTDRTLKVTQERRSAEATLSFVTNEWTMTNVTCSVLPNPPFSSCSGVQTTTSWCGCACTATAVSQLADFVTCPADGGACTTAGGGAPPCQIAITSKNLFQLDPP